MQKNKQTKKTRQEEVKTQGPVPLKPPDNGGQISLAVDSTKLHRADLREFKKKLLNLLYDIIISKVTEKVEPYTSNYRTEIHRLVCLTFTPRKVQTTSKNIKKKEPKNKSKVAAE